MVAYRRNYIKGGCYFFTVTLLNRRATLLTDHIDALRASFRKVKQRHPFTIDAIVILPDHLHCIWTLPENDDDFSLRWREIKSTFSLLIIKEKAVNFVKSEVFGNGVFGSIQYGMKEIISSI